MKNKRCYGFLMIIYILLVCLLCSCETKKSRPEPAYRIYYVNQTVDGITSVGFDTQIHTKEELIQELLQKLQSPVDERGISSIPASVEVRKYKVTQNVLTIDFSKEYNQIDHEEECLRRAAIVLTLDQIPNIEHIIFTIENQPLMIQGELIESMDSNDFSSDSRGAGCDFSKEDFKLYFANESGKKLKEYDLEKADYSGMTKEQFVVKSLIAGPMREGYTETLPSNIELLGVSTVDGICYVDFDESFLDEQGSVSNKLVIYSIVNSLLELTDINKVQISVNGSSQRKYHNDISLEDPFIRNLNIVEN